MLLLGEGAQMKKVLVIGAGFLQDFVICRARELGYDTIAIDGSAEAIGLSHANKGAVVNIVDQEACYEFAKNEGIDGVLTAATDYGVLSASYVAAKLSLPGLKYESAQRIKNKYEVRRKLIVDHVDDTKDAFEVDEYTDLEVLDIHYPVMVKPCDGSGSRATKRANDLKELREACKAAIEVSLVKRALIETFIIGREYGAESIVVNGEVHVLGIMKKWMTEPPYYAELGHQIPSELPSAVEQKAREYVERAIKALEINHGAVNMDLLISDEGTVHIIDVGARMGGNMIGPCVIPYGTGVDYVKALIQNAVGEPVDLHEESHDTVATRLLAFHEGTIKQVPDIEEIEREYGVEIYHHMTEGMHVNEYHTNLDGCGYVIARARTASEAVRKAEGVKTLIEKLCLERQ